MTEIGLLMISVLSTKQTSLTQQQPLQPETDAQQLVPTTQITPPEFIPTESALSLAQAKILTPSAFKVATSSEKFNSQPLPSLSFGSSGTSVRVLQQLLVSNGYTIRVDGVFGVLTEVAVRAFQNHRNLGVDGIVGQNTWRELTIN